MFATKNFLKVHIRIWRNNIEKIAFSNFYQIGEFIVIGIVFILLWFLSKKKIFEYSSKPTILGILNTIMAVSVCVVIPFIITLLSHSYGYAVIFPQSETEYTFFTGISELVNYMNLYLYSGCNIFMCLYSILGRGDL